jgi:hypothetical protein
MYSHTYTVNYALVVLDMSEIVLLSNIVIWFIRHNFMGVPSNKLYCNGRNMTWYIKSRKNEGKQRANHWLSNYFPLSLCQCHLPLYCILYVWMTIADVIKWTYTKGEVVPIYGLHYRRRWRWHVKKVRESAVVSDWRVTFPHSTCLSVSYHFASPTMHSIC